MGRQEMQRVHCDRCGKTWIESNVECLPGAAIVSLAQMAGGPGKPARTKNAWDLCPACAGEFLARFAPRDDDDKEGE